MSAHPLSERLREIAGHLYVAVLCRRDEAATIIQAQAADVERAADALDSAATFEADVRGEIERLTEENRLLHVALEDARSRFATICARTSVTIIHELANMGAKDCDEAAATARAALPAERDEKP